MNKNKIPSYLFTENRIQKPNNISILLLDGDHICLSVLSKMLRESGYKVMTSKRASDALCILRQREHLLDLILADAQLPDMDKYQFLETMARISQLPVIIMSSDRNENSMLGSLYKGAVFHLVKPITWNDIKTLWQFSVIRKRDNNKLAAAASDHHGMSSSPTESRNNTFDSISLVSEDDDSDGNPAGKWWHCPYGAKRKEPETSMPICLDDTCTTEYSSSSFVKKKKKIVWTTELHNKFLQAISFLGLDAYPKKILEHMNVPGLKKEHISSHLQKYRLSLKREHEEKTDVSPNDLGMYQQFPQAALNLAGDLYQFPPEFPQGIVPAVQPEINNSFNQNCPANMQAAAVGPHLGIPGANFHICAPTNPSEAAQMSFLVNNLLMNFPNLGAASPLDNLQNVRGKAPVIVADNGKIKNEGYDFGGNLIDESVDWRALFETAMREEATPVHQLYPIQEQVAAQPAPAPLMPQPPVALQIPQPLAAQQAQAAISEIEREMLGAEGSGGVDPRLFNMLNASNNFLHQHDFSGLM